jgi:hypothetical protein
MLLDGTPAGIVSIAGRRATGADATRSSPLRVDRPARCPAPVPATYGGERSGVAEDRERVGGDDPGLAARRGVGLAAAVAGLAEVLDAVEAAQRPGCARVGSERTILQ